MLRQANTQLIISDRSAGCRLQIPAIRLNRTAATTCWISGSIHLLGILIFITADACTSASDERCSQMWSVGRTFITAENRIWRTESAVRSCMHSTQLTIQLLWKVIELKYTNPQSRWSTVIKLHTWLKSS
jgi:hypothetical protein